jgi:hypothetical protein
MIEYTAIIVALIAVFGAALPYLLQRNKELNLKIAEQKRAAYTIFLNDFTETAVAIMHDEDVSGKDADRKRMLARDQLMLYGSDEVVKAYDAWIRYADTQESDHQIHDFIKETELVNLIFLAIRKDILGKTKVTPEHISNLNPFNRG